MCAPPRAEKRSAMVAVVPGHTVHHNYHLSVNPLIERVCHEAGGTGERTHRRLGAPRGVPDHRLAGVRRGPGGRPPPLGSGVGVPQPQRPAGGGGAAGGAGGDGAEQRGRGTAALATVPHGSYHEPPSWTPLFHCQTNCGHRVPKWPKDLHIGFGCKNNNPGPFSPKESLQTNHGPGPQYPGQPQKEGRTVF